MSGLVMPTWSILFTASTTGFRARRSMLATSWSAAVSPVLMSQRKTITVAFWMAISACLRMKERIWVVVPGSMPPVSTMSKARPRHSHSAYSRSRVTPGVSSTMESRRPTSLLKSMDLPTLGRPTMATRGFAIGVTSFVMESIQGNSHPEDGLKEGEAVLVHRDHRHPPGPGRVPPPSCRPGTPSPRGGGCSGAADPGAQVLPLQLGQQVLAGEQPRHGDGLPEEVVLHRVHLVI